MDQTLLKDRLKRGDKKVFDSVFLHYYTGLCAYVYKIVNDRDVAEDLVQDFFAHFWNNCADIEIQGSLKAYFFSSVRNRSFDYLKHQNVKDGYADMVLKTHDTDINQNEYIESELLQQLEHYLNKLQPRCKEIFIMSRVDGFTNKEIAQKLKISRRTVELQISNALKTLRREIKNT